MILSLFFAYQGFACQARGGRLPGRHRGGDAAHHQVLGRARAVPDSREAPPEAREPAVMIADSGGEGAVTAWTALVVCGNKGPPTAGRPLQPGARALVCGEGGCTFISLQAGRLHPF